IQRLSREQPLFVLERERMQMLGEEKERQADESAFWDGAYLLDGTVDQNGYARDTVTIDCRLTPSKGRAPISFQVSGDRANPAEVINRLAGKVMALLKVTSTAPEWDAKNEAEQYFQEAQWALRWGVYPEAEMAADSAWALGERSSDCAYVRIKAYVIDAAQHSNAERENIRKAEHALALYDHFIHSSSDADLDSKRWDDLGADVVRASAQVLRSYYSHRETAAQNELADLRAMIRSEVAWLEQRPCVREYGLLGGRHATPDKVLPAIPGIIRDETSLGCFWQETPEDAVALYRKLMANPVFCYLHPMLWLRNGTDRLVAWNEEDRKRIPAVWNSFIRELNDSTNLLLQLEGKAFRLADARDDSEVQAAFNDLFGTIFSNRDALVANNVELFFNDWGIDFLVWQKVSPNSAGTEPLYRLFNTNYRLQLRKIDQEYKTRAERFDEQKKYLSEFHPFNPSEFHQLFGQRNYSDAQVREILPLLAAYKSNIVVQVRNLKPGTQSALMSASAQIEGVENGLNQILHPAPAVGAVAAAVIDTNPVADVLAVSQFLALPWQKLLPPDQIQGGAKAVGRIRITAHHVLEGKLVLDFKCENVVLYNPDGTDTAGRGPDDGIAIFDLPEKTWSVVQGPKTDFARANNYYHRTTLLRGELYTSDNGRIQKYDPSTGQWKSLEISDGGNYELFAVNGHLYAADRNIIFEILEGGKTTRLMASNRRHPAISALDGEDLGTPVLFGGPNGSLRIATRDKIFTWTGADWHEDSKVFGSFPEVFQDGVLFRYQDGESQMRFSGLPAAVLTPECYLIQHWPYVNGDLPSALWTLPSNFYFINLPAALRGADPYILADHSKAEYLSDRENVSRANVVARDGYHAELMCFSRERKVPTGVCLRFDSSNGELPLIGIDPTSFDSVSRVRSSWMCFGPRSIVFGLEAPRGTALSEVMNAGTGRDAGIWLQPLSVLDERIAARRQVAAKSETVKSSN
ncbi:MAG TPA: hypothetical protein VN625_03130, partial [Desulfuromonadaceae bacterium]|nr:hypothetical protein [Desulfuromonadaceae bacterium]